MESRLIVIDDDQNSSEFLRSSLMSRGFNVVHTQADPLPVTSLLESQTPFDIALINVSTPHSGGQELLEIIKKTSPPTECIVIAAFEDMPNVVQCLRQGAYDYIIKPFTEEAMAAVIQRASERKRLLDVLQVDRSNHPPALANSAAFKDIITCSAGLLRVLKAAELHADSGAPILITGESGTGKKLLAKAIHDASRRAGHPFLAVDMAALSHEQFEADFCGQAKEASAGTVGQGEGHLRHCHRGTLCLDHIGNLPIAMQDKLIRILQTGEISRVETSVRQKVDVRFVAATSEDLESLIRAGRFRKDLFCRFRGSWLHLPPLRERPEDIPLLSDHFLKRWGASGKERRLEAPAMAELLAYEFPDNVNELQAVLRQAIELAQGKVISADCLPGHVRRPAPSLPGSLPLSTPPLPLAEVEKQHILSLYRQMNRNKVRTARALGVGLNTLRRKLKMYDVK
jgi:DNA-binding NtrC family response regulator